MRIDKIREIAERYQNNTTAKLGFVFKDLKTGQTVEHHGAEAFPTASAYKIFLLAELFRKDHDGECSLDDRHVLAETEKSLGSGILAGLDAGMNLTLRDYATLMMILSDNTATNVVFRTVGREGIKKNVIQALGLKNTKCDWDCNGLLDNYYDLKGGDFVQMIANNGGVRPNFRNSKWYRCDTELNTQTAPLETAELLELLYRGEWVSPETSEAMLAIMKRCRTNSRIPALLPDDTEVAHKTGTLDRLGVDIGIVYTEKGDYVLCLFYNGNLASEEDYAKNAGGKIGTKYLAELSREIYQAYVEDKAN